VSRGLSRFQNELLMFAFRAVDGNITTADARLVKDRMDSRVLFNPMTRGKASRCRKQVRQGLRLLAHQRSSQRALKLLVARGLAERTGRGHYRMTESGYALTTLRNPDAWRERGKGNSWVPRKVNIDVNDIAHEHLQEHVDL
jgi:hypothetical protein